MLKICSLSKKFGGLQAIADVSFEVDKCSIHGLIGPNGAGKTTTFNMISGLLPISSGDIFMDGNSSLNRLSVEQRARLGIGRTFQNIRLFNEMTVLENVMTGMHMRITSSYPAIIMRFGSARKMETESLGIAMDLLKFVSLDQKAGAKAGEISYGAQRKLEIARAMAADPKLLLLDEPCAGMNPTETSELKELIKVLPEKGLTIMIVEHDMEFIMNLCDKIVVLNFGNKIAEGSPDVVRKNSEVIEAYLGSKLSGKLLDKGNTI